LRSTPSTIWAPERWIAPTRRNSCSMLDRALALNDPVDEAVLGIEGCSPDCGRPGVDGSGGTGFLVSLVSFPVERWTTVG
jgi:hypothetical protein